MRVGVNATPQGKRSGTRIVQEAGWVTGPVWTDEENLTPPIGVRSPARPTSSELLYRLSYPSPLITKFLNFNDDITEVHFNSQFCIEFLLMTAN